MGDEHRTVVGTLLSAYPLTTSVATLLVFAAAFRALRHKSRPTFLGALWPSPLYLWGLESVGGILGLFRWGNLNDPELLREWQRLLFGSLYCAVGLVAVEWLVLRLEHGADGPLRLKRGQATWSHALVIGDVLLNLAFWLVVLRRP